jgi:hypothetical protein
MKTIKLSLSLLVLFGLFFGQVSVNQAAPAKASPQIAPQAPDLGPSLTIPTQIPALSNAIVTVPIEFAARGNSISSIIFSIDYSNTWLSFDSTVPLSITLDLPDPFRGSCTPNVSDTDGEIDCFVLDPSVPLHALPDRTIAYIKLRTGNAPQGTIAPVNFSLDSPPTSFGNTSGQSVAGNTINGSVLIGTGTLTNNTYAPMVYYNLSNTFSISGWVTDSSYYGILGVTVSDNHGHFAYTDSAGYYMLGGLSSGTYIVSAYLPGYSFAPTSRTVVLPPNATNQNFMASVGCSDIIMNGSFEYPGGWDFIPTEYTARRIYIDGYAHTGEWVAQTGILDPYDNIYSYSSVRQLVYIDYTAFSATFRFDVFPISGDKLDAPLPPMPKAGETLSLAPNSPDLQYVLITDYYGNILQTLMWRLSDAEQWQYREYSLLQYAGMFVYLHFGTYNDGWGGVTAQLVDTVSLEVCK